MTFSAAVSTCLSKYATFSGRAPRSEYWWFALFNFLVGIVATVLDKIGFGTGPDSKEIFGAISSLALLVPSVAVAARRLHDVDRSGFFQLLPVGVLCVSLGLALFADSRPLMWVAVAATVGATILFFVWTVSRGTVGANRFGGDPIASDSVAPR
ncbi:MAG: DUF805 domain-containing protein [Proteobacteria bacterium]|nr:DUF805 domain-containing protein [Pseudomonadota bacterium]MBS0573778.1 DUF805 domain-containing protein [Pseudomonadota bacterium]